MAFDHFSIGFGWIFGGLMLLAVACPTSPLQATQTDNRGLEVVPVPGPVKIDGDLADWDLSAQVLICYDVESLIDMYSARVALMHDADALYVAIDWTDRTPLGNRHDPRFEAGKGWAGDAVQLRLKTDRIAHLTAWYYAPRSEPFINIDYGKSLTEPFKGGSRALHRTEGWNLDGGAAMAFARRPDGSGYVQEIRLPWALITNDGRPHEQFRCGIELLWGEGDFPVHRYADNLDPAANNREFFWTAHNAWGPARLHRQGNLTLPEPAYVKAMRAAEPQGPVPVEYTLPHDARVTIAIDDARGQRVRNLIAALPRTAGAQVERWDGLDDEANLVEPGTYRWKGIYHTGIRARYAMSFANPGQPTWDTPDNRGAFYGDHTPPHAAAAGGDFVALACPLGESGRHLIGLNLDGQRLWGLNNRHGFVIGTVGGRASLATDGTLLWIAQDGPDTIYRVDLATGAYRPWGQGPAGNDRNEPNSPPRPAPDATERTQLPPSAGAAGARNEPNLPPSAGAAGARNEPNSPPTTPAQAPAATERTQLSPSASEAGVRNEPNLPPSAGAAGVRNEPNLPPTTPAQAPAATERTQLPPSAGAAGVRNEPNLPPSAGEAGARNEPNSAVPVLDLKVGEVERGGEKRNEANLVSIAVHDGLLAAALRMEDRIRLIDAHTGTTRAEYALDDPRAVTFLPDGRLIALSGDRLVRLDANGQAAAFAEQPWPDGYGLTSDAEGRVYLTVRGAYQNVQVFSRDGRHLREIGQRGGRPAHGPFIDTAMRKPAQPAIDARGRLWITEETFNPKRTSVWSADGELIRDFVGTTGYAAAGSINPDDPHMAFSDNTVYRIDLASGDWRPVYSLGGNGHADQIFRPSAGSRARIYNRDDSTYVFSTVNRNGTVLCTIRQGGQWRIAAAFGVVQPKNHPEGGPNFEHPLMKAHVGEIFAWADEDGDGIVQPAELRFAPPPTVDGKPLAIKSGWWGALPGSDGTITHATAAGTHVLQFAITGYTPAGAPIYDPASPRIVPIDLRIAGGMIAGGSAGRVYFNASPLTGIDAEGNRLFTYPSRHVSVHGSHTARAARPGYLIGPSSILGSADFGEAVGEVFSLNGNLGENYLFTHDGLWIQSVFKDVRSAYDVPARAERGMSMDSISAGGESFGGHFMRAPDGRVYLTIGTTDARIIELTGFDTIQRIEGTITVTPEQHAQARAQQQAQAASAAQAMTATARRLATPPTIDGKPGDWPGIVDESQPALLIGDDRRRVGRVAVGWDERHLYIAWRVADRHAAMRNAGRDAHLLFKTGDCVDLMIGDAEAAPASQRRLLLSRIAGKPAAVLYQPHVAGTAEADRVAFSSPWRTIHFDRVAVVEDVRWQTGAIAGGWFVEAAIPWQRLGVTAPAEGLSLRADVGILSADPGGTITTGRHYWSNKATNLVNDIPGEAELTPRFWGTLRLGGE